MAGGWVGGEGSESSRQGSIDGIREINLSPEVRGRLEEAELGYLEDEWREEYEVILPQVYGQSDDHDPALESMSFNRIIGVEILPQPVDWWKAQQRANDNEDNENAHSSVEMCFSKEFGSLWGPTSIATSLQSNGQKPPSPYTSDSPHLSPSVSQSVSNHAHVSGSHSFPLHLLLIYDVGRVAVVQVMVPTPALSDGDADDQGAWTPLELYLLALQWLALPSLAVAERYRRSRAATTHSGAGTPQPTGTAVAPTTVPTVTVGSSSMLRDSTFSTISPPSITSDN
eukprot:GHVN01070650.1.p1 GENE.GHVN01070650.1~~GHVN01070650.1.p1  ORF type:complete len:321 (-),score=80.33 GHVN01070650.1:396-1247(-)